MLDNADELRDKGTLSDKGSMNPILRGTFCLIYWITLGFELGVLLLTVTLECSGSVTRKKIRIFC